MENKENIIKSALETIDIEANAVQSLRQFINDDFAQVVQLIHKSKGRVVITGIGKSAIIANKLVATFNSTGTPALFMHAADAIHGDLGMVLADDVIICISKSGSSPEIKVLVPLIKSRGNQLIGMVGNEQSFLAQHSDFILNTTVEKEACPNNLAPTASTTAQLAMGDALAVSLLKLNNFGAEDFAQHHPGGALGKKLYLKTKHLAEMHDSPSISPDASIEQVISSINESRLGATVVLENGVLKGIITDGDIRRMIVSQLDLSTTTAKDIMGTSPKTVDAESYAIDAYQLLKENNINHIIVLQEGNYAGLVHIQDIIKEGIV